MRLTDRTIAGLQIPPKGQKLYTDDTVPGFAVRVSQGGSRTFVLTHGADRRRQTLGRWPIVSLHAARQRAMTILAQAQLGIIHKPSPTFSAVKEEYLARRDREVRAATRQGDTYLFRHFNGLDRLKLAELTPEMIDDIIAGIEALSTRRSAFIRISGLMSYAVRRGYIDRSPVQALKPPPDQTPRHRVLGDTELAKLLTVARMRRLSGDQYGAILELLVYTGQRKMQIAGLQISNADFENNLLTWEPDQMKTARRHVIPLGAHVRSILETMQPTHLYFPNRIGQPFCGWSYHFRKLTADLGFSNFVVHDIRRTLATRWQEMAIEIAVTERLLSHSAMTGGLIGVYQRSSYLTQLRTAIEKWEDYLAVF